MLIPQMNSGLVDAGIYGRCIDVDSVELFENVRLLPDRDPADFDPTLAGIGKRRLVPEQQEGAGLRFDARISAFCLHADDGP